MAETKTKAGEFTYADYLLWPEGELPATLKDEIIARTALKRLGSPEDVAKAVLYLAKDAPYVTGQIIAIDGGRSLGAR